MTQAYPLHWPQGRARKPAHQRKRSSFKRASRFTGQPGGYIPQRSLTIEEAVRRLQGELDRLSASLPVISSNLELRLDGRPRSGQREPDDPGVCVYFQLERQPIAMPCDTYDRVADNIAAIAAHIEATRKIDRYGVASVTEMFAGFMALPAPGQRRPWWAVLGFDRVPGRDAAEERYRELAKQHHPDRGGDAEAFKQLVEAMRQAREELTS